MTNDTADRLLNNAILAFVGISGPVVTASEPVERGFVRRFAQAIMDDDPRYGNGPSDYHNTAPPLLPLFLFNPPLSAPDRLSARAEDPDFDGSDFVSGTGLPELPLPGLALLNGGAEIEFFRYARQGETIQRQSRYSDISERQSGKGAMLLVRVETRYSTTAGDLLMIVTQTDIRR